LSEHARRFKAAIPELEATKIRPSNYLPPLTRLYRATALKVRPLHYSDFHMALLGPEVIFTIFWSVLMWDDTWWQGNIPVITMVISSLAVGVCFGFLRAFSYVYGRRKWRLIKWDDL